MYLKSKKRKKISNPASIQISREINAPSMHDWTESDDSDVDDASFWLHALISERESPEYNTWI